MGESGHGFEQTLPGRAVVPPQEARKIPPGKVEKTLTTAENFSIPTEVKGKTKGFEAEIWLMEHLKSMPGVESVRLSSRVEDNQEKVDLLVTFKGEYLEPIRVQVATGPQKSEADLPPNVCLVMMDINNWPKSLESAEWRIIQWLKKHKPKVFKGLVDYHNAD
jgi:hypothetical protein